VRTALLSGGVSIDVRLGQDDFRVALRRDAVEGLTAQPKWMAPVWFYDDRGSALYEQITRLPEYYPFRTERDLLRQRAGDIAEVSGSEVLVELGSGTSEKTRLLLAAMSRSQAGLAGYVAFDVSEATLRSAAAATARQFDVGVHAIAGDFHRHLHAIPDVGVPRLVAFLGSTIGNFDVAQRQVFLRDIASVLGPDDRFLLATDLVKPVERLVAAYDDAAGVTGEFNRNLLRVLNRELGADFVPSQFDHLARWNEADSCIEMRLSAQQAMGVDVQGLDLRIGFAEGEEIRTEISTKFTPDGVRGELAGAGMAVVASWTDPAGDYLLTLARPQTDPWLFRPRAG
jgi:L-histidine N-alpha-methyltransferase